MTEKTFKPILAPNEEVDLATLKYPLLASTKLDGIRCIIKNGEILSRSLKSIQNEQIRCRLEPIRIFTEQNNVIFDGELFSPELTFQQIVHFVMTQDLGDEQLPKNLKFYCFDCIENNQLDIPFNQRLEMAKLYMMRFSDIAFPVEQINVDSPEAINKLFEVVLKEGYEGLILRNPKGKYKFGRGTVKEGLIYKVKPFVTFDAQIIGVVQATEVNQDAEKKINELGRSVTSKKKNDRHTIDKASAFMVYYNNQELKVVLAMTDEEKEQVWLNKESYIGKWMEYKGMLVGSKDVPRHPVMLRFREDKE